jgi:hypothetical protein
VTSKLYFCWKQEIGNRHNVLSRNLFLYAYLPAYLVYFYVYPAFSACPFNLAPLLPPHPRPPFPARLSASPLPPPSHISPRLDRQVKQDRLDRQDWQDKQDRKERQD